MEIQKIFSDASGEERIYSVLMSEDEMMLFSKMEDMDYIEDQNNRKRAVKHSKATGALIGGSLGAAIGSQAYKLSRKHPRRAGLIGAGIGALGAGYLGHKVGKSIKEATEKDADKEISKYKSASESDKKYLRKRAEAKEQRRLLERQARAQEQMARNSYRL